MLDLKTTGCQLFSCLCSRVAPIPNLDELQVIFVGNFGSKYFREMFSLSMDVSLTNWLLWVRVKSQIEFFLTSSLNCGIDLLRYAIMPKKRCKSCLDFWKDINLIALIFSGSGEIPFPDIFCLKNISQVAPKTHLSLFSFKSDFRILFKACSVRMSN